MNFTKEQLEYIEAPLDQHSYLKACPGSGKTEVVAAMVSRTIQVECCWATLRRCLSAGEGG